MAEDGRPSERGHPERGCFSTLTCLFCFWLGALTALLAVTFG